MRKDAYSGTKQDINSNNTTIIKNRNQLLNNCNMMKQQHQANYNLQDQNQRKNQNDSVIYLKNARSSSLPLKIMKINSKYDKTNDNNNNNRLQNLSNSLPDTNNLYLDKILRNWSENYNNNSNSLFRSIDRLNNAIKYNNNFNNRFNNLKQICKNNRLSLSEHFINLIQLDYTNFELELKKLGDKCLKPKVDSNEDKMDDKAVDLDQEKQTSNDRIKESNVYLDSSSCGSSCNSESSINTNTSLSSLDDRSFDFDEESNNALQLNENSQEAEDEKVPNEKIQTKRTEESVNEQKTEEILKEAEIKPEETTLGEPTIIQAAQDTQNISEEKQTETVVSTSNESNSEQDSQLDAQNVTNSPVNTDKNKFDSYLDENEALLSGSCDTDEDELTYRHFLPKKSCLSKNIKQKDDSSLKSESSSSTAESALTNSSESSRKRVSFADSCGKDLYTVRTMSEPSNCPPKLTSKVVQYFLNRELNNSSNNPLNNSNNSSTFQSFGGFNSTSNRFNEYGQPIYTQQSSYPPSKPFFPSSHSYGITDTSGLIAVYSLNFAQPAGDYLKFRQRLEESCVSLENVLLNRFLISGTIKVKNINFHKHVFVRCTFNNWSSYEDYQAAYVPCEFFTSSNLSPTSSSSPFFGSNDINYQPLHREYDTFRFEFELPKSVERNNQNSNLPTGSVKFCICYKSGADSETKEFWDSNDGKNYEILQYAMDAESSKANHRTKNFQNLNPKQNYTKIETNSTNGSTQNLYNNNNNNYSYAKSTSTSFVDSGVYY